MLIDYNKKFKDKDFNLNNSYNNNTTSSQNPR